MDGETIAPKARKSTNTAFIPGRLQMHRIFVIFQQFLVFERALMTEFTSDIFEEEWIGFSGIRVINDVARLIRWRKIILVICIFTRSRWSRFKR